MNTSRRLVGLLAPHRGRVGLALALTALASLLNVPAPLLIQGLLDRIAATGSLSVVAPLSLALLGVFVAQAAVSALTARAIGPVGLGVVRDLRHALYARLQTLGLAFYDRMPTGSILARMMDDVEVVQGLVTGQTLAVLTDLGTTLAIGAVLLARGPAVAAVVLSVLLSYVLVFRYFNRRIRSGSAEVRERLDRIFSDLKERIDGALVVRACGREDAEMAEFARRIGDAHGLRVRVGRLGGTFSNLSAALAGIGAALVFAVAAYEALRGRTTPGGAVATATLAGLLFGPVARLADLANVFQQARASLDRLGEILDREPDVVEPASPIPLGRARGHVEFDRVGFGYEAGRPVVWDVRLRVRPGMRVALVGPTGCGKSTLMNLLLRFYDTTWGEIRLDGVPLGQLASSALRRQVGVVLQDPIVFAESLAENIRYGAPEATDAQVEAAARAALAHEFAEGAPDGYATRVGDGGFKLSQGERQRLAIARAFCTDPAIVILDEATSALDAESESAIQAALDNLLEGRTAFIVAHRLATVAGADLIVVMDGGLVVQMGTHDELLADEHGLYRRLCARQFGPAACTPRARGTLRPALARALEAGA